MTGDKTCNKTGNETGDKECDKTHVQGNPRPGRVHTCWCAPPSLGSPSIA